MYNFSHNFNVVRGVRRDLFCDMKLVTQCGSSLSAHKVILSAASKKLEKAFSKSPDLKEFQVRNVNYETLVKIVDFVYDGKVLLNTQNEMNDFADAFTILNMYLGPKFNSVIKTIAIPSDHSSDDGSQDTFSCNICAMKYASKAKLTRHERDKHIMKKKAEHKYKCEKCGRQYTVISH